MHHSFVKCFRTLVVIGISGKDVGPQRKIKNIDQNREGNDNGKWFFHAILNWGLIKYKQFFARFTNIPDRTFW